MNWSCKKSRPKRINVRHDSTTSTCHDGIKSLEHVQVGTKTSGFRIFDLCAMIYYNDMIIYSSKSFSSLSVAKKLRMRASGSISRFKLLFVLQPRLKCSAKTGDPTQPLLFPSLLASKL